MQQTNVFNYKPREKKIRYKNHTSKHIFFKKYSFPKRVNVARVDEKKETYSIHNSTIE